MHACLCTTHIGAADDDLRGSQLGVGIAQLRLGSLLQSPQAFERGIEVLHDPPLPPACKHACMTLEHVELVGQGRIYDSSREQSRNRRTQATVTVHLCRPGHGLGHHSDAAKACNFRETAHQSTEGYPFRHMKRVVAWSGHHNIILSRRDKWWPAPCPAPQPAHSRQSQTYCVWSRIRKGHSLGSYSSIPAQKRGVEWGR